MNNLGQIIIILIANLAVVLDGFVVHPAPLEFKTEDLIRIHESPKPIEFHETKQSELAPESEVVGVYFDTVSLNIASDYLLSQIHQTNSSSKQSQDFDIGEQQQAGQTNTTPNQPATSTSTPRPPTPTTVEAGDQSSTSSSSSQVESITTTTPQPVAATTSTPTSGSISTSTTSDEIISTSQVPSEAGVATKTVRQGAAVFCGEANPNGKSNKKLVLDRIIGGRKTEPGEFPFQVRLNIRSRRGSGICGGVILDENHILTAAHCMTACVSQYLTTVTLENTGVHATVGDHAIRSNDGEIEVEIDKITPHEKYDACNFYANDHDIALIKTSKPIEYRFTSDGYGSINRPCMPNSTNQGYKDGESVIVSGWGVTRDNSGSLSNILRYVQVPVVSVARCQETYGSRVTNDHVCAGYQSGGKDSCQGDSGGPLVRVMDNRYELVGIVSFGYGCGQPGAPGVYTRVASYLDWIKANL